MNRLFSLLMQGYTIPDSFSWYAKKTEAIPTTDRITKLVGYIMQGVTDPADRRALYASVLCNLVMMTQYGPEIKAMDPDNTYVPVIRPPETSHQDPDYCMHDLILPIYSYKPIVAMLEDDIAERLDGDSWFDLMGAACLQLLREAA